MEAGVTSFDDEKDQLTDGGQRPCPARTPGEAAVGELPPRPGGNTGPDCWGRGHGEEQGDVKNPWRGEKSTRLIACPRVGDRGLEMA